MLDDRLCEGSLLRGRSATAVLGHPGSRVQLGNTLFRCKVNNNNMLLWYHLPVVWWYHSVFVCHHNDRILSLVLLFPG